MDYNIKDVSGRLKSTREYLDISVGEMANKTNVTTDEYISLENGEKDFSLSFLNQAADALAYTPVCTRRSGNGLYNIGNVEVPDRQSY